MNIEQVSAQLDELAQALERTISLGGPAIGREIEPGATAFPVQPFGVTFGSARPPAVSQTDRELAAMARTEPDPAWVRRTPPAPIEDPTVEGLSASRVGEEWREEDHVELIDRLETERDARWMDE
jgi:hypothetical protein